MTDNQLTIKEDPQLALRREAGASANDFAASKTFTNYTQTKSTATLKSQRADLRHFVAFLGNIPGYTPVEDRDEADVLAGQYQQDPTTWTGMTHGLVELYRDHMVNAGYALATVNRRLSTVKRYAALAYKAGVLSLDDHSRIRLVSGYSRKEGLHLDQHRQAEAIPTRVGDKKERYVAVAPDQAQALKHQPDTPQGRRDAVLMGLLIDLGLRCGEVALLKVEAVDLERGELRFYRPKVNIEQTHQLSQDLWKALRRYIESGDAPASGPLLRTSNKSGGLGKVGMSNRAIAKRVKVLGVEVGLVGLSPHDLRHYWATQAARAGVDPFRLQEAGGWSSLTMPRRYVEQARIANEGMV